MCASFVIHFMSFMFHFIIFYVIYVPNVTGPIYLFFVQLVVGWLQAIPPVLKECVTYSLFFGGCHQITFSSSFLSGS